VNVETIRYYQRRGLIGEPHKPPGGHRRYPAHVTRQIAFIRRAKQLGFSLAEVQSLLKFSDGRSTREARLIAEHKVGTLEPHIRHLQKVRRRLTALIDKSRKAKARAFCPIIAELNGGQEPLLPVR
jgi:MerR family transcriptional regulator, mercuric resistance operon regulatory protein